ncbi:hypothetical protein HF078_16955 [Bacillus sp. RO2]|jgi:hypothetical protein|uniref:hypothetical protein n=1 Tax=Bacillus sp. RO2 TaxID=2723913 RepID=UPI00145CE012|nr:hypothetical protein [Bacillus sp. RO2]NMH74770.1 hypothetical protein [Bacillus sp. RO2]
MRLATNLKDLLDEDLEYGNQMIERILKEVEERDFQENFEIVMRLNVQFIDSMNQGVVKQIKEFALEMNLILEALESMEG